MATFMLGNTPYEGRDKKTYSVPTWKSLGFLFCPVLQPALGSERLFRVWSRHDMETGRFFSLVAYKTRREAEMCSNVMQFGNGILYQTEFSILKGTPIWLGKVHQGEDANRFGRVTGSQVFLDWESLVNVKKVRDLSIVDDMNGAFVIDRKDEGQLDS